MISFVMTDRQTTQQTNRINSLYVVKLIATRAEWQKSSAPCTTTIVEP